ncbi:hypothetical protein DJ017_02870 [Phenylobacterium soli]|uniref:Uncharacterized protein n=1 Tax=Phenylobacterium soli TaxID=2170551 RepID=A0A328AF94_9CAUL|nr:hypothetical protein DJ017_02870 [Phenylobacterium soli]
MTDAAKMAPPAFRRARYAVERTEEGMSVVDIWTGHTVVLGRAPQMGLTAAKAEKLVWKLNFAAGDRNIRQ